MNNLFQEMLREELNQFLLTQKQKFPAEETLKIDLHIVYQQPTVCGFVETFG